MLGLDRTTFPDRSTICTNAASSNGMAMEAGREPPSSAATRSAARRRIVVSTSPVSASRWRVARNADATASASANTTATPKVILTRTVKPRRRMARSIRPTVEAVAGTADGLDGGDVEGVVDLAADAAHVHLDVVGIAFELEVPHRAEDLRLGDDLVGPADEELEHGELSGGEADLGCASPDSPARRVEPEAGDAELHRTLAGAAAQ